MIHGMLTKKELLQLFIHEEDGYPVISAYMYKLINNIYTLAKSEIDKRKHLQINNRIEERRKVQKAVRDYLPIDAAMISKWEIELKRKQLHFEEIENLKENKDIKE